MAALCNARKDCCPKLRTAGACCPEYKGLVQLPCGRKPWLCAAGPPKPSPRGCRSECPELVLGASAAGRCRGGVSEWSLLTDHASCGVLPFQQQVACDPSRRRSPGCVRLFTALSGRLSALPCQACVSTDPGVNGGSAVFGILNVWFLNLKVVA